MTDQRPHSWHLQPEIANLSPDSFTAQKLVHGIHPNRLSRANSRSNMRRPSISILRRGASSLAPYLYAHPR